VRRVAALVGVVATLGALTACGGAPGDDSASGTNPGSVPPGMHIHAIARDPASGALLLATHDGLYVSSDGPIARVGPAIDLMGFTVAGPGHFYASGHPSSGTNLPQPVGLIESRDGGRTWSTTSRGGKSDFHALTYSAGGIVAFDGLLRTSEDGRRWRIGELPSAPSWLAGSLDHVIVLATTAQGLLRSTDAGATWRPVSDPPSLVLVDWAARGQVVGIDAGGELHVSGDAGMTWQATDLSTEGATALASSGSQDDLEILVATERGVLVSRSLAPFVPAILATGR